MYETHKATVRPAKHVSGIGKEHGRVAGNDPRPPGIQVSINGHRRKGRCRLQDLKRPMLRLPIEKHHPGIHRHRIAWQSHEPAKHMKDLVGFLKAKKNQITAR
jgi:hypothetical protein